MTGNCRPSGRHSTDRGYFFYFFSLSLSLLGSKFFNQEGNTCLLCIKHSKTHLSFKRPGEVSGLNGPAEVNVRDFIQNNYTQYDGDESFLAAPTSATHLLWERLQKLQKEEHEKGGVLECETEIVSSLTAYGPGYIDPEA